MQLGAFDCLIKPLNIEASIKNIKSSWKAGTILLSLTRSNHEHM